MTRDANGIHRWFKGGSLNAAYLATEVPARTRGSQAALIYDSPVTGQKRTLLYAELDEQVGRMAHVLKTEFGTICYKRWHSLVFESEILLLYIRASTFLNSKWHVSRAPSPLFQA